MIKNERQYRTTRAQADRFAKALRSLDAGGAVQSEASSRLLTVQKEALQSQLSDLETAIQEYETLKAGNFAFEQLEGISELPKLLIRARIASGLSQRGLADRLGLKEQQIQRYEANDYASASFTRIRDILSARNGGTAMALTQEKLLTADDLLRLDSEGFRGELIRGALCETMPTGVRHGHIVVNLTILLGSFIKPRRLGWLLASEVGFLLERDPDTVRAPDIAYISAGRFPLDADLPGYYEGVPDLAIEILSPSDRPREIYHKARMWISFGAPLVWVVDPANRAFEVHCPNQPVMRLDEDDTLDGGAALPGFRCPVRDVFEL